MVGGYDLGLKTCSNGCVKLKFTVVGKMHNLQGLRLPFCGLHLRFYKNDFNRLLALCQPQFGPFRFFSIFIMLEFISCINPFCPDSGQGEKN